MKYNNFWIESDCSNAVSWISRKDLVCSDFDTIITDIRELYSESSCKGFCFTVRETNLVAHVLAKTSLAVKESSFWIGSLPPVLIMYCWTICPVICNVGNM